MLAQVNIGILILRIVAGLLFAGHGAQKLFGWFGGRGFAGWVGIVQKMGARPAPLWAGLNALAEFAGGLGLALGLLTPIASAGLVGSMVVAIVKVHWPKGIWNTQGGIEFPLLMGTVALVVGLIGPGSISLDALLGLSLPEPETDLVLLAITLIVTLGLVFALSKLSSGLGCRSIFKPR
jgi:putative oxidoreductase